VDVGGFEVVILLLDIARSTFARSRLVGVVEWCLLRQSSRGSLGYLARVDFITVGGVAKNSDVTNKLINQPLDYIPTVSVRKHHA
jgi:hypothetical protein